jgi:hypothetical protein
VGLHQCLGVATSLQPASAPTSQAISCAPLPSNSTSSLGQNNLILLQQNGVGSFCSRDVWFVSVSLGDFYALLFWFYNATTPLLNLFAATWDGEHTTTEHGECFAIFWRRQCT